MPIFTNIPVAGNTGNVQLDTVQVTTTAGAVQLEVVGVGDPNNGQAIALVTSSAPAITDYALTVKLGLPISVTSVAPGSAATSLGKANSSAAAASDVGVAAMYVRRDNPVLGALVSTGQYVTPGTDQYGRAWVNPAAFQFVNVTSAGVVVVASTNAYLAGVTINTPAAGGIVTIYNATSAVGQTVGSINCSTNYADFDYFVQCSTGITVSTAGAPDFTVRYTR